MDSGHSRHFFVTPMATVKNSKEDSKRMDVKEQVRLFGEAMGRFQKRDFAGARELFAKAATGPDAATAHSSSMHMNMCDRRTVKTEAPKTAEEQYVLGVTAINAGSLDAASQHLANALRGHDNVDHYHYAMALCQGLKGDLDACRQHLARAIELAPANRIAARNDSDFQSLARQSPIKELLHVEKAV